MEKREVVRMVAIDMEMPNCCGECNLTACKGYDEPWNYCCSVTLTDINLEDTEKPNDCPLVEIEERKVGKWIGDKAYPICPKCNCNIIEEYISCTDYAEMYKPMKFCPNCGAEMEGNNEIN